MRRPNPKGFVSICGHYGQRRGVPPPDRALPALRVDSRAGPRPTPANPTRKRAGNPLQGTPRRYASTHSTKTQRYGLERKEGERRQGSRAGPIRRTCDAGQKAEPKERAARMDRWPRERERERQKPEGRPRADHPREGERTDSRQSRARAA